MKTQIKVLADYDCYPLWLVGDDVYKNISPDSLPISADLADSLDSWAMEYTATLNRDDPRLSGFPSNAAKRDFVHRGLNLAERLEEELGGAFDVTYYDAVQKRIIAIRRI